MAIPMSKPDRIEMCARFIESRGLPAERYSDGVRFKFEGGLYVLVVISNPEYFSIVYPRFHAYTTAAEREKVEIAAIAATRRTKVAKVVIVEDSDVSATVELFVSPPDSFKPVFPRLLSSLQHIVKVFKEEIAAT